MRLPNNLFNGYKLLERSRVVNKKDRDEDALSYFEGILNKAQPSNDAEVPLRQLVRDLYFKNPGKFRSLIRGTSLECLVLWTESKAIVEMLGLRGVVYIKWNGPQNGYSVTEFRHTARHPLEEKKEDSNEHVQEPVEEDSAKWSDAT